MSTNDLKIIVCRALEEPFSQGTLASLDAVRLGRLVTPHRGAVLRRRRA